MSWSYTVNGSIQDFVLPASLVEDMATQHLEYPADMLKALKLAQSLGMKSAVCTGFRTPNPYGSEYPEVMEITVKGTAMPADMSHMIKAAIASGPDCAHEWAPTERELDDGRFLSYYRCVRCGQSQAGSERLMDDE